MPLGVGNSRQGIVVLPLFRFKIDGSMFLNFLSIIYLFATTEAWPKDPNNMCAGVYDCLAWSDGSCVAFFSPPPFFPIFSLFRAYFTIHTSHRHHVNATYPIGHNAPISTVLSQRIPIAQNATIIWYGTLSKENAFTPYP